MRSNDDDLSGLTVAALAREITAGAVRLAAATAAWLRLVADFDEREGWGEYGIRSCAHWLAWQCGMGPGTAREHVRVARALRRLPLIDEAFAAGRLSYSKVRALTRVAESATEAALLDFALEATASQTERVVRQWRRADAVDDGTAAERLGAAAPRRRLRPPRLHRDPHRAAARPPHAALAARRPDQRGQPHTLLAHLPQSPNGAVCVDALG